MPQLQPGPARAAPAGTPGSATAAGALLERRVVGAGEAGGAHRARTRRGVEEAALKRADGSAAGLTLHTFDGTIPQLRRSLDRSLDAFFDLLPGADDEDVEKFGD